MRREAAAPIRPRRSVSEPSPQPVRPALVSHQQQARQNFEQARQGPAPLVSHATAARQNFQAGKAQLGGGRVEPNYDVPQWMRDRQQRFNQANRRELSDDEFARLSGTQQKQVRLNSDLMRAFDLDVQESPVDRRNIKGVISQLGLAPELEERATKNLSVGTGPAVTYAELMGKPVGSGVRAPGATQEQSVFDRVARVESGAPGARGERAQLVSAIAQKLDGYLAQADAAQAGARVQEANAQKDTFTFGNEQAKLDFEYSFDYLLNPQSLAEMPWAEAKLALQQGGYDPEDFKTYARDRIQMYPTAAGLTSLRDLESWFGQE